jgi:MFS family permease
LILRSKELGLSFAQVVLAFAIYNAIFAIGAFPFGHLSDRIGRKPVIIAGWLVYAGVYGGFAAVRSSLAAWILLAVYGLYQAFTDGITKALVTDVVSKSQRAGAIGLFYTVAGVGTFAASLLTGWLWNVRWFGTGVNMGLAIGAVFALLAIPLVASVRVEQPS